MDLLTLPGLGRILRWRHARTASSLPLFLLAALPVLDGLTGPQLAPKNRATVLVWVHYSRLPVLALLLARWPAVKLLSDPWRSGVGRFSRRRDLAALVVLFTFGALLNAFAMVRPVYEVEGWLAERLGTASEGLVLGLIFVGGFWPFVPVIQGALADLGWEILGPPRWELGRLLPTDWLLPLEQVIMAVGWAVSLEILYRLSVEDAPERPWRAFLPWTVLTGLLWLAANWLMAQPMDMRGTMLG